MNRTQFNTLRLLLPVLLMLGLFPLLIHTVRAQEPRDSFYNEDFNARDDNAGPVRLARFTLVSGRVAWRADDGAEWSDAATNLPLRQSGQIWVEGDGRAELQFDDGSLLRLGTDSRATLKTLYSDSEGEFTQITLTDGPAVLNLKHDHAVYQVDTPYASVKSRGPAKLRMTAGDEVEIEVESGQATVEGRSDQVTLRSGQFLALRDENSRFEPRSLQQPEDERRSEPRARSDSRYEPRSQSDSRYEPRTRSDSWDRWNDERDRYYADLNDRPSHRYLPPNIGLVAGDLDEYGTWRSDAEYGRVWCPRVSSAEWRPYRYGHWVWVTPFGWTWVSDEPWGWAPYHYGTWVHASYGWGWVPGPRQQYWCPAVVNFSECDGQIAWAPLCPAEVRYPSVLSIGFGGRDWSVFFSIGRAAVYYPTHDRYCEARPFNTYYANRVVNVTNVYNTTIINRNTYFTGGDRGFVPINARHGGVVLADAGGFAGRGRYHVASGDGSDLFRRGRVIGAPSSGHAPVAGPVAVRPTAEAATFSRTFLRDRGPAARSERQVFSAPVDPRIARNSRPLLPTGALAPATERTIPRTARESGGQARVDSSPDLARRRQPWTGRTPEESRQEPPARRQGESADRVPSYGQRQPERDATSSARLPRSQQDSIDGRVNRPPLPERSGDRESAADSAMRARRTLNLPSREPRTPELPVGSRPNERPNERRWTGSADRESGTDAAIRARRTLNLPTREPRVPESTVESRPSERRWSSPSDSSAERSRRTMPGYEDTARSRQPDSRPRYEPPARTDREDRPQSSSPRNQGGYSTSRPYDRRPDTQYERPNRTPDTYSPPSRRERTWTEPEVRRSPDSGQESHGRQAPQYTPRRPAESYSEPPHRDPPAYRPESRSRYESGGSPVRREPYVSRPEANRPVEPPHRDPPATYRSRERAPEPSRSDTARDSNRSRRDGDSRDDRDSRDNPNRRPRN